jgi:hypothetical protein
MKIFLGTLPSWLKNIGRTRQPPKVEYGFRLLAGCELIPPQHGQPLATLDKTNLGVGA